MNSILITGATGFISRHLIPSLCQNWRVTAATRRDNSLDPRCFPPVTSITVGEIHGSTNWRQALQNIDTVIHLAAHAHPRQVPSSEAEFFKVNTAGTVNLVEQSIAAKIKHFVFISSIAAIATRSDQPLTERSTCQPVTPYGRSKLLAEQSLISLASGSSMSWTILRPTLVYGPGEPGNMQRLIKLIQRGWPLPLSLIQNRRSFVYVGNLVDAIATSLTHPHALNQIFLLSDGQDVSTPELIHKLADLLNCPCTLWPIPPIFLRLAGHWGDMVQGLHPPFALNTPTLQRLLSSLWVDSSHIQKTLDWSPPFTLDQGLLQTLKPWNSH